MAEGKSAEITVPRELVEYASGKQLLPDKNALALLRGRGDARAIIDSIAGEGAFVLTVEGVEKEIRRRETRKMPEPPPPAEWKAGDVDDFEPRLRVLPDYDVTEQSRSTGKVEDFLNLFRDKFRVLAGMLRKRQGLEPREIKTLRRVPDGHGVDVIGMVAEKWVSKKGHWVLRLEDEEASCLAVLSKDNRVMTEQGERILLDSVIGVKAKKLNNEMLIAEQVFWPELPAGQFGGCERDVCLAVTSDIHVGSKLFMEKEFTRFLAWLNGSGVSEKDRELVKKIRYLVVAGDTVDGVGIYPAQFDELAIKDIYAQYAELTRLLKQVPGHIQVIVCPGQHDAVRRADPQPAIPREYVPELYAKKNFHFVGSPSWVEIEGLKVLLYHGGALHDMYSKLSFLDARKPHLAMKEVLKRRDLMPGYGIGNPYVPEKKDYMLIRLEPDLYIGGDMHHTGYDTYRGCIVVNGAAWQERTDYMVEKGIVPTPGVVPIVSLKTGQIFERRFAEEGE